MAETGPVARLVACFARHMPTREQLAGNRLLAPVAHRIVSPELWRFTRRSVPRGVALGIFCALIFPIGHIFLAAFLALPTRANVPLAAALTFIANPFTLPVWALLANRTGELVLHVDRTVGIYAARPLASDGGVLANWYATAGVTAFGFAVLSVVLAALGYIVASFTWRGIVMRRRRRTLAERRAHGPATSLSPEPNL
jgi:uncharacterized protein (DUF2062 family)